MTASRAATCIRPTSIPPSACVTSFNMTPSCQVARGGFSREALLGIECLVFDNSRSGTRHTELVATMDHSNIRGLSTALHRSVAGLPLSESGDHRVTMPTQNFRGFPSSCPCIAFPIGSVF
jgi:hypothetical protein